MPSFKILVNKEMAVSIPLIIWIIRLGKLESDTQIDRKYGSIKFTSASLHLRFVIPSRFYRINTSIRWRRSYQSRHATTEGIIGTPQWKA
jgi:hypothetical protein